MAVAVGGSIGAVLRFLVYILFEQFHKSVFPWPTLVVNLTGALVIGLLWGYFDRFYISPGLRMFIFVGILGSFTTFSTFAFDSLSMAHDGHYRNMLFYIFGSNILGIGLALLGFYVSTEIK